MKYYLGKCDYNGDKRTNCEAYITWEFDGNRFSMCAEIWQPNKRDTLIGGQCVEEVAKLFPNDKQAQRMVAIWKQWHLNDMKAGSPAQTEWLDKHGAELDRLNYYTAACKALAKVGLNPDPNYLHNGKPYAYGSAWLKREIPTDVANEIRAWLSTEAA